MRKRSFKAAVPMGHKGPAIVYPFDPAEVLGPRPRQFVRGTLNGAAFEGEIGCRRRVHYTCVPADLLAAAKVTPGDVADVTIEPREPSPEELAERPPLVWARMVTGTRRRSRR
jgi:hypothetical protein